MSESGIDREGNLPRICNAKASIKPSPLHVGEVEAPKRHGREEMTWLGDLPVEGVWGKTISKSLATLAPAHLGILPTQSSCGLDQAALCSRLLFTSRSLCSPVIITVLHTNSHGTGPRGGSVQPACRRVDDRTRRQAETWDLHLP